MIFVQHFAAVKQVLFFDSGAQGICQEKKAAETPYLLSRREHEGGKTSRSWHMRKSYDQEQPDPPQGIAHRLRLAHCLVHSTFLNASLGRSQYNKCNFACSLEALEMMPDHTR